MIQCEYEYREDVDTKFAPVNSNREEALRATNSVIKRLNKIVKLDEFQAQIDDMVKMGTMIQLKDEEIEGLNSNPQVYHNLYKGLI